MVHVTGVHLLLTTCKCLGNQASHMIKCASCMRIFRKFPDFRKFCALFCWFSGCCETFWPFWHIFSKCLEDSFSCLVHCNRKQRHSQRGLEALGNCPTNINLVSVGYRNQKRSTEKIQLKTKRKYLMLSVLPNHFLFQFELSPTNFKHLATPLVTTEQHTF